MGKTLIISLILFNVIFIAFLAGIFLFIRQYRLKKRSHENELLDIDEQHKKELLQTQIEIQNQTLQHIGREIHDNIGQKITLASIYTQQLSHDYQTKKIDQVNEILNESLVELRKLSKTLTNDSISVHSLPELIEIETKIIEGIHQLEVSVDIDKDIEINATQTKTVLIRIIQEFIQNSLKHAQCSTINLSLQSQGNLIELSLKDNGIGFDTNQTTNKGIGLKNIEKRVELIQADYELNSKPTLGTELLIKIPKE